MKTILFFLAALITQTAVSQELQWEQTNGPNGGFIEAIATKDSIVFASAWGSIYRSSDNCKTWQQNLLNKQIRVIAGKNNIVLAGSTGAGVYRTINNESSWVPTSKGFLSGSVSALAINKNIVAAGNSSSGVYFSEDTAVTKILL